MPPFVRPFGLSVGGRPLSQYINPCRALKHTKAHCQHTASAEQNLKALCVSARFYVCPLCRHVRPIRFLPSSPSRPFRPVARPPVGRSEDISVHAVAVVAHGDTQHEPHQHRRTNSETTHTLPLPRRPLAHPFGKQASSKRRVLRQLWKSGA